MLIYKTQSQLSNTHKRWNRRVAHIALTALISLASINYFIDPYQVFHSNTFLPSSTSNERFNKIGYLLHNRNQYNSFLLGSSRMGVFNPKWFNQSGVRYYNLSVFSGDAKDSLKMLKLLKKNEIVIKQVIVGIDLFPFIEKQRLRPASLQHHPLVSGTNYFSFYSSHLFNSSLYQSYLKIEQHYGQRSFTFDYKTGQWSLQSYDRLREKDPTKYNRRFFKKLSRPAIKVHFQNKRFLELQQLIVWLNMHDIKARYFIHPFNNMHQQRFTKKTFIDFRNRIQELIPNILDFSARREWTNNNANYYEEKHYRVQLAKTIALKIQSRNF